MRYSFNHKVLHELSEAVKYEWLETNKCGAYASSTVVGMNSRREHGLFAVPHETMNKRVVVLSKLEESVFIENRLHEISTNQYEDSIFPTGFTYLEKFEINPFPRFIFRVEDRLIQKTLFLLEKKNLLVIRYELKNQGAPVKLVIKPFISDRFSSMLSADIQGINTDSYLGHHFVRWAPRPNMPELYVYYNRGEYLSATLWYHNFYYIKDKGRYKDCSEDLFNPGFFQTNLEPYETLDFYVSTEEIQDIQLEFEGLYRRESNKRVRPGKKAKKLVCFQRKLAHSYYEKNKKPLVSVSSVNRPGTMLEVIFSMPAMFLLPKNTAAFKKVFLDLLSKEKEGLLPSSLEQNGERANYSSVDLSLWLINLGYIYLNMSQDLAFFEGEVFDRFRSIYESYLKGTSFNIYADRDGLIFAGDKATSLSWIPLRDKKDNVLRYGKLLEVNALWYNAVRILEFIARHLDKSRIAGKFAKQAQKIARSFPEVFLTPERNGFYDYINHSTKSTDFRINQLIPLALPFSLFEDLGAHILNRVDEELVTPYGVRSLSPMSPSYRTPDEFSASRNNVAYYNRCVWPWTIALYAGACLKFKKRDEHFARDFFSYFKPLMDLTDEGVLGYIPEAIHLNKNITQIGINDYTPAMAAVLWAWHLLRKG